MPTPRTYAYKGWSFHQSTPGKWDLVRLCDGYTSQHDTHGGCRAFIRQYGASPDPDIAYMQAIAAA